MASSFNNNMQINGSSINSENIYLSNYKFIIKDIPSTNSMSYFVGNSTNNNVNNSKIEPNKEISYNGINNSQQIRGQNNQNVIRSISGNQRAISPMVNPYEINNISSQINFIEPIHYSNGIKIINKNQNMNHINGNIYYSQPIESMKSPTYKVGIGAFTSYFPKIEENKNMIIIQKPPVKKLDPIVAKKN